MKQLNTNTICGAPASYHSLISKYCNVEFDYIIEGGSRDCVDAIKLNWSSRKKVFAFECNPTCLDICRKNLNLNDISETEVELISSAIYHKDTTIDFFCTIDTPKPPFGKNAPNLIDVDGKKANIGTSSIFSFNEKWNKIHTSKKVNVPAVKLDTFIETKKLQNKKYILCLDLQGAEFYAIKGNEQYIKNCQLIVLEGGTHQYKAPNECKMQNITALLDKYNFIHANKKGGGDAIFVKNIL
tara:strand:+ start:5088 stop:5810 length:723 start_codon:yes stop_codon:yes gene_type:complete